MWLYVPSASSPAAADSTLDSESLSMLARSATSRGTLKQSPYWSKAWRKGGWIRRLSGLTCKPSTLEHGVAQWIASLADSPARTSRSPESAQASTASVQASGQSSPVSLGKFDPGTYSLRTSQGCLLTNQLDEFLETFPRWGSMRDGEVFEHPTPERRTEGNGRSSWPAALSSDSRGSPGTKPHSELTQKIDSWPTPTSGDSKSSGSQGYGTQSGRHEGWTLTDMAVSPRGPQAQPTTGQESRRNSGRQSSEWPTPRYNAAMTQGTLNPDNYQRRNKSNIEEVAAAWRTPRASDGEKGGPNQSDGGPSLSAQAAHHQGKEGKRRLNPRFVEWLMNWEIDSTAIVPRTDRLRILGNGVVPAQAALAVELLTTTRRTA